MRKLNKFKVAFSICAVLLGTVLLIECTFAEKYLPKLFGITMLLTGFSVFVIAIFAATALDYSVGDYECRSCGHRFVPTFGAYIWGIHTMTTRHLKCPKCGKKSFCKRRFSGDE